ncbi:Mth938-like domain-containing protein [[Eubacterium] cellulosolvens]
MIDEYRFGHIVIKGKEYTSDVKIFPERVVGDWWRTQGHSLAISDISDILAAPPEVLIIGTGSAGVLKVPESVQQDIKNRGIELIIERTGDACEIYNRLKDSKRVVAALHLTC